MAIKPNFEPGHVGGFIKDNIIPDDMSVTAAASLLGVDKSTLSKLMNEKSALSAEMALRIEKVFGVKMDTLMRMQTRYDTWHMRQKENDLKLEPYQEAQI